MKESVLKAFYFNPFVRVDDVVYACNMETNGLFRINDSKDAELVGVFPKEKLFQRTLFSDCVIYKNKIIFAPESAEHIQIFDLTNKKFTFINFKTDFEEESYIKEYKFSRLIETETELFFMPETYPYILKMHKDTFEITYISIGKMPKKFFARRQYSNVDKTYYMVSLNSPYLLKFDVEEGVGEVVCVPAIGEGATGIYVVNNEAWVISNSKTGILKVDLNTFETIEYRNDIDAFSVKEGLNPYACGIVREGSVTLIPMGGNELLEFDCRERIFKRRNIIEGLLVDDLSFGCIFQTLDGTMLVRRARDMWDGPRECVWIDNTLDISEIQFMITDYSLYRKKLISMRKAEKELIHESDLFGLVEFIEMERCEECIQ